jgi:hypothetical protein
MANVTQLYNNLNYQRKTERGRTSTAYPLFFLIYTLENIAPVTNAAQKYLVSSKPQRL